MSHAQTSDDSRSGNDPVVVTIRDIRVVEAASDASNSAFPMSGPTREWKLGFTLGGRTSTVYCDDLRAGSVFLVNRAFLLRPEALQGLLFEAGCSGSGEPAAFANAVFVPARHWLNTRNGYATVRTPGLVCELGYELECVTTSESLPASAPAIYAIQGEGRLLWYRRAAPGGDSLHWRGPMEVGHGWTHYLHVFAGESGSMYAVESGGALLWRRHLGAENGRSHWDGPKQIGDGWQYFRTIIYDGAGVIYALDAEGRLWWYRHNGFLTGDAVWEGPRQIGEGWNEYSGIVAGGNGVIYATVGHTAFANLAHCGGVRYRPGDLIWHRHSGRQTGEAVWFEPQCVGRGWDRYSRIFSDRADALYGIVSADVPPYRQGDLLRCRHLGHASGAALWSEVEHAGSGWSGFRTLFCAL